MTLRPLLLLALPFLGCAKPISTAAVCQQLVAAGVASNCHPDTPKGLGGRASEATAFDLPSVPGHGGSVFGFDKSDDYAATVKSFEGAAVLAGPWRFGSDKTRIFVQMNDGASPDIGAKAKAVVAGL